jgi:hypothetical protein
MRSFLSKLLGRQNRTAAWRSVPALNETLTVDLTTHRFGNVAVGEPIDRLSFLGPADNCHEQSEIFDYSKRGFYLVEDEGRLEAVVFILRPERSVVSFAGSWVCDGRSRTITSQTRPQDIRWDLGDPSQTETEPDGELIWVYEFPGVEWEFAWSPEQALESVEMRLPGAG